MKQRNYKWLEMVESIKEILKKNEDVEINKYNNGEVNYVVLDKFNLYSENFRASLTECPLENGTEYKLYVSWMTDKFYPRNGMVTIRNENNKIRFSRNGWFKKDENDKPLSDFEVGCKAIDAMIKANEYNRLNKMVNENWKKKEKIHAYIENYVNKFHSQTFNLDQLKEIVENGLLLEEINNMDLFKIMTENYFNGKDEKLYYILKCSVNSSKDYFLALCNDYGLFKNNYCQYNRKFYKVPDELQNV